MDDQTAIGRSAMHHKHLELGGSMSEKNGWLLPSVYGSPDCASKQTEEMWLKESVGLCDISPATKLALKGDKLEELLAGEFTGAVGLALGQVRQVSDSLSNPITLARLAEDEALILSSPLLGPSLIDNLGSKASGCAHLVDVTSGMAGVAIAGPKARDFLGNVTELDTSEPVFGDLRCAQSKVAEVHGTLLRVDRGGALCFQLYFPREFGEYLWDVLVETARHHGGGPVGFQALESLQV